RITEKRRSPKIDTEKLDSLGVERGPLWKKLQQGEDVTLPGQRLIRSRDVLLNTRPLRSVVYCTDTEPCQSAVQLARDTDLLIHEATYGQDLSAKAHERGHSTA